MICDLCVVCCVLCAVCCVLCAVCCVLCCVLCARVLCAVQVREGTPGKAIFLINHGTAHVLKGGQVVVVLSDHEFFGEQSIITDVLCTASVRAVTYCDMAILMREHFQQARRALISVANLQ